MGIWKAILERVTEEKFPSPTLVLFVPKFSPSTNETCKNRRENKIWVILSTEK
jgi:L-fucose isomerase-like protein